jgi:ribosomal protein S18 acetylase RimI-like enzyme
MQVFAPTIRIGSPDDLLGIYFADPLCQSVPDRARMLSQALARGECFVATQSDRIVGFVIRNSDFFGQAFVPLLVVAVANRRAGIGTACCSAFLLATPPQIRFVSPSARNICMAWVGLRAFVVLG